MEITLEGCAAQAGQYKSTAHAYIYSVHYLQVL